DRRVPAMVDAGQTDVVVNAVAELGGGDQPAAERVVDLQAEIAREVSRHAGHDHLVAGQLRGRRDRGQRRRGVDQRRVGRDTADSVEVRIDVLPRQVADRRFAGELAGELEGGADLDGLTVRIALFAVAIEGEIV